MRPVSSRLLGSLALLSALAVGGTTEASASGRGSGVSGGGFARGAAVRHGGLRPVVGFPGRNGTFRHGWGSRFGHHGRFGYGRKGRGMGFGCPGGRFGCRGFGGAFGYAYGYGYGYGYPGYGYADQGPAFRGPGFSPIIAGPIESGIPVAVGIRPPPVLPPAIYVVGAPRPSARVRRIGRSATGPVTADSDGRGAGRGTRRAASRSIDASSDF